MLSMHGLVVVLVASLAKGQSSPARGPLIILRGSPGLQPRLEIRELEKNADQWNVFLLGFKRMKETKSADPMSYYQIAGIHGWPFKSYNGIEKCSNCLEEAGYCPHASTLFLTWHRPHLALFEQSLRLNTFAAVNEFPDGELKKRYLVAADTLRLPYWDWAAAQPAEQYILPQSIVKPTVSLVGPRGLATIENPLLRYQFKSDGGPPGAPDFPLPKDTTARHFSLPPAAPVSNQDRAVLSVQKIVTKHSGPDLRCNLYRLMSNASSLNLMSNKLWDAKRNVTTYDNMESIHDAIHRAVGGDSSDGLGVGTMYWSESAAFDPIFWMQHAMVDRLFAMYQVLFPDNWLSPADGTETWTIYENETVDANTPLTPFRMDGNGLFWTSNLVRNHRRLGYTYPEFYQKNASPREIKAVINRLYSADCMVGPGETIPPSSNPRPKDPSQSDPQSNVPPPSLGNSPDGLKPGNLPPGNAPPASGGSSTNGPTEAGPAGSGGFGGLGMPPWAAGGGFPWQAGGASPWQFGAGSGPGAAAPPWFSGGAPPWWSGSGHNHGTARGPGAPVSRRSRALRTSPSSEESFEQKVRKEKRQRVPQNNPSGSEGHSTDAGGELLHSLAPLEKSTTDTTLSPPSRSLIALSSQISDLITSTGALREYIANIRINPSTLDGASFKIYLFDGTEDSTLGYQFFMINSPKSATSTGRMKQTRAVAGAVTLTSALMERVSSGQLGGMGNEEVMAFLKGRLGWRIVKMDGSVVTAENLPGVDLSISIVTTDVQPAASMDEFPIWGPTRMLMELA